MPSDGYDWEPGAPTKSISALFPLADKDTRERAEALLAEDGESTGDPVRIARDYVEGTLLSRIADPVERWNAVGRFAEELPASLERIRALCVGQLVLDGDSSEEAGEKLGINRQRASALLKGHDQPTPRQLKTNAIEDEPGYRLGVFLGVASTLAELLDLRHPRFDAGNQVSKLAQSVHQAPRAVVTRINEVCARWMRRASKSERLAELHRELVLAASMLDDLPVTFLPVPQQGHMWVASSRTRIRLASS